MSNIQNLYQKVIVVTQRKKYIFIIEKGSIKKL